MDEGHGHRNKKTTQLRNRPFADDSHADGGHPAYSGQGRGPAGRTAAVHPVRDGMAFGDRGLLRGGLLCPDLGLCGLRHAVPVCRPGRAVAAGGVLHSHHHRCIRPGATGLSECGRMAAGHLSGHVQPVLVFHCLFLPVPLPAADQRSGERSEEGRTSEARPCAGGLFVRPADGAPQGYLRPPGRIRPPVVDNGICHRRVSGEIRRAAEDYPPKGLTRLWDCGGSVVAGEAGSRPWDAVVFR